MALNRPEFDGGSPSLSLSPFELGKNHQVLAYAYEVDGDRLTLLIYDPNYADRDDVTLSIPLGDPRKAIDVRQSPGGARIHAFFRVDHRRSDPP